MRIIWFLVLAPLIVFGSSAKLFAEETLTILVSPTGGKLYYQGKSVKTETLRTALKKMRAGTTVQLLPGRYNGQFELYGKNGTAQQPMIVKGVGNESVFACGHTPHQGGEPIFKMGLSSYINFENLHVNNCWPTVFHLRESHHIGFTGIHVTGAQHVVLAERPLTHHISVTQSQWTQDANALLWNKFVPSDIMQGSHQALNGGFFVGRDVGGDIEIANNRINSVFRALTFLVAQGTPRAPVNQNIYIHHNHFHSVRDAVFTTTGQISNLWFSHNVAQNIGALCDFGSSLIKQSYIFGNVLANDAPPTSGTPAEKRSLVFRYGEQLAGSHQQNIFNNTLFGIDGLFNDEGRTEHFVFTNNVVIFRDEAKKFLPAQSWHKTYQIDFNFSNLALAKESLHKGRGAHHFIGTLAFTDPAQGQFQLESGSPASARGRPLAIAGWRPAPRKKAPDIGAYDGQDLIDGPKFIRVKTSYDAE